MNRTAVVLFNLGGPDCLRSVRPFLYNIFNDPAILPLSPFLRSMVAAFISWMRAPNAKRMYKHLGGYSPLLHNTEQQAQALQHILGEKFRVFVVMRYWQPRLKAVLPLIQAYDPDQIILLPLYPQFSSATTASALVEWERTSSFFVGSCPTYAIRSHSTLQGFVTALAESLCATLAALSPSAKARVLFSAHGLPQALVARGDPYVSEVEATVSAVLQALHPVSLDWRLCYQSRVGPVQWTKPYLEQEIIKAAREGLHLVIVPVAFVSEHSETLFELDHVYRSLAEREGALSYTRLSTVGAHPLYIAGLADMVKSWRDF